jgi:hypothetical protein
MSVRRINQTGRKRIGREHVKVGIQQDVDGTLSYRVELDLSSYQFAPDAKVLIEAYRQHSYERFDHGSVETLESPSSRSLTLFRVGDQVQFRLKVVDTATTEGCLLGEADKLKPDVGGDERGDRISLLPTEGRDLGEEGWRLEIEDGPLLLVNNRLGDYRQLARTPAFVWLVYPAVLRDVLRHILVTEEHRSVDDPSDWRDLWLMAAGLMRRGTDLPSASADPDIVEDWISDAVAGFSRNHRLLDKFGRQTFGGEDA